LNWTTWPGLVRKRDKKGKNVVSGKALELLKENFNSRRRRNKQTRERAERKSRKTSKKGGEDEMETTEDLFFPARRNLL